MLDVAIKIASALNMALNHDLLHCDIKPGNISSMLTTSSAGGFPVWHAKPMPSRKAPTTRGTPYYVAPEKIKREPGNILLSGHVQPRCHPLSRHRPLCAI